MSTSPTARALAQQWAALAARPDLLASTALELLREYGTVASRLVNRSLGADDASTDKRTTRGAGDAAWRENPWFDALRQGYEATARVLLEAGERTDGLDEAARRKVRFFARQALAALAPANFPWSNPVVAREAWETGGASLMRGLINLSEDIDLGNGRLRLSMSDESAAGRSQSRRHARQGRLGQRPHAAHPYAPATKKVCADRC
jgi:polyhydroxyalkanoate synthase